MTSVVLMPPDLAYVILLKFLMEYVADVLTRTASTTAEAYNVKEMSEILLNIGESIKISNSLCTDETEQFIKQLSSKIDRTQLNEELIKAAEEQASKHPRFIPK